MLEILAAIYIVKMFANAAKENGKKGWPYGLLGFVLFYGIAFVINIGISIFLLKDDPYKEIDFGTTIMMSIISIVVSGLVTVYLIFPMVNKHLQASNANRNSDVLDHDLL